MLYQLLAVAAALLSVATYQYAPLLFITTSTPTLSYTPPVRWSTYRPGLYYGLRASHPQSPLMGLMWYGTDVNRPLHFHQHWRHWAEERDQVTRYGYVQHDGGHYGKQVIVDTISGVNLTTTYINSDDDNVITRISGQSVDGGKTVSLLWYVALDNDEQSISLGDSTAAAEDDDELIEESAEETTSSGNTFVARIHSHIPELHNDIRLQVTPHAGTTYASRSSFPLSKKAKVVDYDKYFYAGIHVDNEVWRAKEHLQPLVTSHFQQLSQSQQQRMAIIYQKHPEKRPKDQQQAQLDALPSLLPTLPNSIAPRSNLLAVQYIVNVPFTIDITVSSGSNKVPEQSATDDSIKQHAKDFQRVFEQQFLAVTPAHRPCAQALLSDLVGGYGYFYGNALVATPNPANASQEVTHASPATTLLSTVPCRAFFPRGFLWDEGFHQLIVSQWNVNQSLTIYQSWLSKVDENGWLPREQILGDESRARVPAEFQPQRPTIANPPTLILTLGRMLTRLQQADAAASDRDAFYSFLHSYLPTIHRHVQWYFNTQSAHTNAQQQVTSLAWRGRTIGHCLASGLDDYPRATWLTNSSFKARIKQRDDLHGVEGHIDLHVWMIALSNTMVSLAKFAQQHTLMQPQSAKANEQPKLYDAYITEYSQRSKVLQSTLLELHWAQKNSSFADYTYDWSGKLQHQVHVGYVSILPLLLGTVAADSPQLQAIVKQISDPKQLWTDYGLRSLSKRDKYYGSAENYWRGPIWMNLNYMTVAALKHYMLLTDPNVSSQQTIATPLSHLVSVETSGPSSNAELHAKLKSLYDKLRTNLVSNVNQQWQTRGFAYEQYDPDNGQGKRSHPFTGWTALTLLLMAQAE